MPDIIQNTKCGHPRYVRMKIRSGQYPFHPLAELELTYAKAMKPADRVNRRPMHDEAVHQHTLSGDAVMISDRTQGRQGRLGDNSNNTTLSASL